MTSLTSLEVSRLTSTEQALGLLMKLTPPLAENTVKLGRMPRTELERTIYVFKRFQDHAHKATRTESSYELYRVY